MLNPSQTSESAQYYNRERPSILRLVDEGPHHILDLGCGAGIVGKKLQEIGKASDLTGVELFESAAQEARQHYKQVHSGDIEEMDLPYGAEFDYVICGDILEHLKDPYTVVKRIHGWLKPGGHFIVSVPNVRHWSVLSDLIFRGAWKYREAGIMDRTHLRFFTRKSCFQMLEEAGFAIETHSFFLGGRKFRILNSLTINMFQEFLGSQIVVRARK